MSDDDDVELGRNSRSSKTKNGINDDKYFAGTEKVYTVRSVCLYACCCILLLALIITFGAAFFYWTTEGAFRNNVYHAINAMSEKNSFLSDSKNMISLASFENLWNGLGSQNLVKQRHLSLCATELLKSESEAPGATLIIASDPRDQILYDQDAFFYALDFKLSLEFGVDLTTYVMNAQHLDSTKTYMTLSYLLTSSYPHFSTIKLIENALDARGKALIKTRDIVLCSNNPSLVNVRPCSTAGSETLFVKNTKLLPMARSPSLLLPSKNKTVVSQQPTKPANKPSSPPVATAEEESYDILHGENEQIVNKYKLEDDFTRDIRIYNVLFYKSEGVSSSSSSSSDGSHRIQQFKESLVLIVKPSKCK